MPLTSKRLQHVSVVSHLLVNQCCARRGNGAMAGRRVGCVSARRKEAANAKAATGWAASFCAVFQYARPLPAAVRRCGEAESSASLVEAGSGVDLARGAADRGKHCQAAGATTPTKSDAILMSAFGGKADVAFLRPNVCL